MPTVNGEVSLFICTGCKLLLMTVDAKYITYASLELNEGGYRERQTGDYDFDCFICPCCNDEDEGFKEIKLPKKVIKPLMELWEELRDNDPDNDFRYGIPADNQQLKEMFAIELL